MKRGWHRYLIDCRGIALSFRHAIAQEPIKFSVATHGANYDHALRNVRRRFRHRVAVEIIAGGDQ